MAGTILKCHDAIGKELKVGDDVAFTSSGCVYLGYVYKLRQNKGYMTVNNRKEQPYPDSHKNCDHPMGNKKVGSDEEQNYKSMYIRKLEGHYGNTRG